MTAAVPYFAPLIVGGAPCDLSHLDPVRFQVPSEKLRRAVTVRCRFSNHVFTRAFDTETDAADTLVIMDGVRRRIFCPDRCRLSFFLPDAILGLSGPRIYVRETKTRRNWLYVTSVELLAARNGENSLIKYQAFFALRRASGAGTMREDIAMVAEGAYAEDPARPPELLGRALFTGLATAAVEGRQVHTQPARRRQGARRRPKAAAPGYRLRPALREHGSDPPGDVLSANPPSRQPMYSLAGRSIQ